MKTWLPDVFCAQVKASVLLAAACALLPVALYVVCCEVRVESSNNIKVILA